MKLRKWVKVALVILLLITVSVISNNEYHEAIDRCVSSGNEYQYCVEGLK